MKRINSIQYYLIQILHNFPSSTIQRTWTNKVCCNWILFWTCVNLMTISFVLCLCCPFLLCPTYNFYKRHTTCEVWTCCECECVTEGQGVVCTQETKEQDGHGHQEGEATHQRICVRHLYIGGGVVTES